MKLSKSERRKFREKLGLKFREIRHGRNLDIEAGAECLGMTPLRLLELEDQGRKFTEMRLSRLMVLADKYDCNVDINLIPRRPAEI